ncbi:MAG: TRAP transporter small permease subunit [Gammaproteobacteria bacterium]|nr:TRAP transporter small permease subunit [Gammaproteobacteria bacterium]
MVVLYLFNNYVVFWLKWPETWQVFAHFLDNSSNSKLSDEQGTNGLILLFAYVIVIAAVILFTLARPSRTLENDADFYSRFAAFIVRAAFWSVLLIGLTDTLISFLRVEDMLASVVGQDLTTQLGRPIFRGLYIHYPLMVISIIIAFFSRTLGFMWLAFLVVLAEFLIVVTRFVFSYEQAFMGDLVRFWYAALFLFASSYTLLTEGHVRVDVLYANFSEKNKARSNVFGSLLLGLPLCWTILTQGMAGKGASINSPLLSFEISQSGFGMYVKYLMAGFLVVFAVSMAIQFVSTILGGVAALSKASESDSH